MLYPLPAVLITCINPETGEPNVMTAAWVGTVCSDPAMVSVSIRPERYSHDLIKECGNFTINLTTEDLAWATDYCGVKSGRDVNKFKKAHLTPEDSEFIDAPTILESPVSLECEVRD
ncbi:MAG: flavin reductase family protein, partial [Eubacteriales bacterium]|nr:flavin reductase family protein [Eubacteriales bacterium]